ncbi:PPE domain-containing protein [Kitasatospora sp. NPDC001664]
MGSRSYFEGHALIPLQRMLSGSNPGRLKEVADHWKNVDAELRAAADDLQKAVEHARQSWEGKAAEGFTQAATRIQQSLTNTASYAVRTSTAMDFAGKVLEQSKSVMGDIEVPSRLESGIKLVGDLGQRSDAQFKADLAGGMDRAAAVNKNYDELSATEIAHQRAIVVMEHLAPQYQDAVTFLGAPPYDDRDDPRKPFPSEPSEKLTPPPVKPQPHIAPPTPNNPGGNDKPGWTPPGGTPGMPKPDGPHSPTLPTGPTGPGVPDGRVPTPVHPLPGGPRLDSVVPPVSTLPAPGHNVPTVPTGPGLGGGGGGGGGGLPPMGLPGIGGGGGGRGVGGGGAGGGRGIAGGAGRGGAGAGAGGAGRGGSGAGAGAGAGGAGSGRTGQPGMGGMPGAGAGGGAGGKAGGGKPSLVRKEGGTVGGAKAGGASGRSFTQGGSGLGQGGQGRGGAAGAGGMPGMGAAGGKKKDKNGNRPDYLVEDEDTWRTGGKANPPVID